MWTLHNVGSGELIDLSIDEAQPARIHPTGGGCVVGVFKGGVEVCGGDAIAKPRAKLLMEGCERTDCG